MLLPRSMLDFHIELTQFFSFILDTDASDKSVGAELIQIQEGEERAVAYGSLTLTPAI
jgi:hypothetical protein